MCPNDGRSENMGKGRQKEDCWQRSYFGAGEGMGILCGVG